MRIARTLTAGLLVVLAGCNGQVSTNGSETDSALKQVPRSDNPYTLFESLQVRPLALSANGKYLFACNTPDNRLEIFRRDDDDDDNGSRLRAVGSVVVGLEPVAVAVRNDREVWVVNHLSDSVSIVDTTFAENAHVVRTLQVGDEPRDIVFAGPGRSRAFITTAHRGQNTGDDPQLFTSGVGRADVWVFDAANLGSAAGGTRLAKVTLFADTPRALAVSADGSKVYAAAFLSGNQTTIVSVDAVKHLYPAGMPGPAVLPIPVAPGVIVNFPQPSTGLIVKWKLGDDGAMHWIDAYGTIFDAWVRVKLPDKDVFTIDANANPPAATGGVYTGVGTTLFNMAVNPSNGHVYVTNTDARNDVRFEGHASPAFPNTTSVRGHIVDNRITVIDPVAGSVAARNLNPHINYAVDSTPGEKEKSVAFPQDIAISRDGATAYVVAQGSSKLAIYKTSDLEAGTITPSLADQVLLTGGGPTGVVEDGHGNAYVLTRFDNGISTVNTRTRTEVKHQKLFSPEPASVTVGRQYLYDATFTSPHGDQACASCHIGGDNDALAWDLGNPGGGPLPEPQGQFTIPRQFIEFLIPQTKYIFDYFQPVKGPMTTQSLRGMDNHGPMHWRGDRNGAIQQTGKPFTDGLSAQPDTGIFNEVDAFKSFNVAFPGLLGRDAMLSDQDMTDFTTFILQVSYPPNPVRNLDNSLTASQAAGSAFYHNLQPSGAELPSDRFHNCNGCHTLNPAGNAATSKHPGFFGSDGRLTFENEPQIFKVPHLRNMYTKVGMFGSAPDINMLITVTPFNATAIDQVRGFGFQHDGALGSIDHFLTGQVFVQTFVDVILPNGANAGKNPGGIPFLDPNNPFAGPPVPAGFTLRHNIDDFIMAFDSNHAPIVGQQITLTNATRASASTRIDLMQARATAGADHAAECDLVATGKLLGVPAGFYWNGTAWLANTSRLPPLQDAVVRALVGTVTDALTYTCVPLGSGLRVGIDRDGDGYGDGDEIFAGTNPADPASHP